MHSESPEERARQKVAEPPSYRIENERNPEAMPQYFQVSVGVLEGRNFTWFNPRSASSYVVIMLGKNKYRTGIRRNKQQPHYREYFVFSLFVSLYDLQRSALCLSVMEPRFCAPPHLVGEVIIGLGSVWRQPFFQPFRKWMQLYHPRDPTAGSMGFLKVDISITCGTSMPTMPPAMRNNNLDVNYLMVSGLEQQPANFIITVHGAFGLSNIYSQRSDKHHSAKPLNTFVRVIFSGLQAKTAVQNRSNNPMYNEQLSMVDMFPTYNPRLRFELCSTDTYTIRVLASKLLNLDHISHDGENGFLPTFGPSLLPLFGPSSVGILTPDGDYPFYRGSLLVSLNTTVPYYQQNLRSVSVEPAVPVSVKNLWTVKNFCIFCPIFEVSMLDSRLVSEFCGVAVTIGEIPTESSLDDEFKYMMNEVRSRKLHYTGPLNVLRTESEFQYLDFSNTYPVLQLATQLPDYRFRMYRNNSINKIVTTLNSTLTEVEDRLKNLGYTTPRDLLDEINRALDCVSNKILQYVSNNSIDTNGNAQVEFETELDKKQLTLQMEEMKKIHKNISQKLTLNIIENTKESDNIKIKCGSATTTRRVVKCLLSDTQTLVRELEKLIFKSTEGWPDIVIWLLHNGSRIGFCKIPVSDIIYSIIYEECGANCGRIQSLYFKPLKCSRHVNSLSMGCFCAVGKVELLAWMGLREQSSAFEPCLPKGYMLKTRDFEMCVNCNGIVVECRVFIYKARLLCNNVGADLGHVYLRIYTLNTAENSKAVEKSSAPIWNQLLKFRKMLHTSADRLLRYPPVALVEVKSTNLLGNTELIGSFEMVSVINNDEDYVPKLRWRDIYKGMDNTGKVLMSIQILQISFSNMRSFLDGCEIENKITFLTPSIFFVL